MASQDFLLSRFSGALESLPFIISYLRSMPVRIKGGNRPLRRVRVRSVLPAQRSACINKHIQMFRSLGQAVGSSSDEGASSSAAVRSFLSTNLMAIHNDRTGWMLTKTLTVGTLWMLNCRRQVHKSVCQPVSLSVCQPLSLSVCQSVSLSVCQSVSLSVCQLVSLSVC